MGGRCMHGLWTHRPPLTALLTTIQEGLCSGVSIVLLSDKIMKMGRKKAEAPGPVGGVMSKTSRTSRMRRQSSARNSEWALAPESLCPATWKQLGEGTPH